MGKKIVTRVKQLQQEYPQAEVQLWAMDEHRVGLKPILRRVWVPWYEQPKAKVNWRFEWVWVYGFVHPASGDTYWWILPRVNIDLFNRALADFAKHFNLSANKRVVLVIDQAGWHTSEQVQCPEGLHLEFLPAYSPELQPAERLWPILNESVANRVFEKLEDLEQALNDRCCVLLRQCKFIQGLTNFHWWQVAEK
jgi:transposase